MVIPVCCSSIWESSSAFFSQYLVFLVFLILIILEGVYWQSHCGLNMPFFDVEYNFIGLLAIWRSHLWTAFSWLLPILPGLLVFFLLGCQIHVLKISSSKLWFAFNSFVGFFFFFFFLLFRATFMAYGGSQARGSCWSYRCRPTPQQKQC